MPTVTADEPDTVSLDLTQGFVTEYFQALNLGHKARNECFERVAELISRHPGGTLPDKLSKPADYHAMDRLMNRPETTHARILAAHRARTWQKIARHGGVVLFLHDTTTLDYSGQKALGLSAVGNGNGTGYLCHNTLAVDPERREVFGLVSQILHQRVAVGKKEGVKKKRQRLSRESRLWSRAVEDLPATPAGQRIVDIADRGADLFEFLATEQRLGRDCVVRSTHNRRVRLGHTGDGQQVLLHDYLRTLPAEGNARTRDVRETATTQERSATLRVAYVTVELLPPHVTKGDYEKKPLRAWAVRIWEENAPEGVTPIDWFLVTLVPVVTVADAWERSDWYACRWMVEEYHKAKKTGCQVENLQFRTEAALQPMIALLSVVAVLLLNLRQAARRPEAKEQPATEIIEPLYEEVLRYQRYPKSEHPPLTVWEFTLALARLGGHMNRRADGVPGWLTLWRGWQKLQHLVDGVKIERRRRQKFV